MNVFQTSILTSPKKEEHHHPNTDQGKPPSQIYLCIHILRDIKKKRLDGKIEVESIEGIGTTFEVILPLSRPSNPPTPSTVCREISLAFSEGRTEEVLYKILEGEGHRPQRFKLGDEAKLIWTDVKTFETCAHLRSLTGPSSPLVVVTSSDWSRASSSMRRNESQETRRGSVEVEAGADWKASSPMIRLRRNGILPHLILKVMDQPQRYSHELWFSTPVEDHRRRSSVGTMMSEERMMKKITSINSSPTLSTSIQSSCLSEEEEEGEGEEGDQAMSRSYKHQELPSRKQVQKKRILLVDDNLMNVNLGRRVLEKMGYEVLEALNGFEAVQKACEGTCQLILMDCQSVPLFLLLFFFYRERYRRLSKEGQTKKKRKRKVDDCF